MNKSNIIEFQDEILLAIKNKDVKKYSLINEYASLYGEDKFFDGCLQILSMEEEPISIINFDGEMGEDAVNNIKYLNFRIVSFEKSDKVGEFIDFLNSDDSKYVFFYDKRFILEDSIIHELIKNIEKDELAQVSMSLCNYVDEEGELISKPSSTWIQIFKNANNIFEGKQALEISRDKQPDIMIGLLVSLCRTDYIRDLLNVFAIERDKILLDCLNDIYVYIFSNSIVRVCEKVLASRKLRKSIIQEKTDIQPAKDIAIEKKITLFWNDKGEYYNLLPIGEEAKRRGYEVTTSNNPKEKAEIGIYCAHFNYPENSKFSVILLHDMAQGHNRWPNIWELERWNIYDLGVLPGEDWGERWSKCGGLDYTNPTFGAYRFGYPKSDLISSQSLKDRANELRNNMNLPYEKSILYAPSWEYGDKEDDFVRALKSLPVNLLIKQAHWPNGPVEKFVSEMRLLHEGKFENVFYIEPEESIMTALEMCDLVVSDESSVMAEALLFNKPSLAVTDWMIPDCNPPRKACVPMDYVIRCKKVELREYVELWLEGKLDTSEVIEFGKRIFGNRGSVCTDIMDAIEYFSGINPNVSKDFMGLKLKPYYESVGYPF